MIIAVHPDRILVVRFNNNIGVISIHPISGVCEARVFIDIAAVVSAQVRVPCPVGKTRGNITVTDCRNNGAIINLIASGRCGIAPEDAVAQCRAAVVVIYPAADGVSRVAGECAVAQCRTAEVVIYPAATAVVVSRVVCEDAASYCRAAVVVIYPAAIVVWRIYPRVGLAGGDGKAVEYGG